MVRTWVFGACVPQIVLCKPLPKIPRVHIQSKADSLMTNKLNVMHWRLIHYNVWSKIEQNPRLRFLVSTSNGNLLVQLSSFDLQMTCERKRNVGDDSLVSGNHGCEREPPEETKKGYNRPFRRSLVKKSGTPSPPGKQPSHQHIMKPRIDWVKTAHTYTF